MSFHCRFAFKAVKEQNVLDYKEHHVQTASLGGLPYNCKCHLLKADIKEIEGININTFAGGP